MKTLEDLQRYVLAMNAEFEAIRGRRATHNRRAFAGGPEAIRQEMIRQVMRPNLDAITEIVLAGKAAVLTAEATVIKFAKLFPPAIVKLARLQLRSYERDR